MLRRAAVALVVKAREIAALRDDAASEGYEYGWASGSWVIDGATSVEAARNLLRGIKAEDRDVLDSLPPSPFISKQDDDVRPEDLLEFYDLGASDKGAEDVLSAFEKGFTRGVIDAVTQAARDLIEEEG